MSWTWSPGQISDGIGGVDHQRDAVRADDGFVQLDPAGLVEFEFLRDGRARSGGDVALPGAEGGHAIAGGFGFQVEPDVGVILLEFRNQAGSEFFADRVGARMTTLPAVPEAGGDAVSAGQPVSRRPQASRAKPRAHGVRPAERISCKRVAFITSLVSGILPPRSLASPRLARSKMCCFSRPNDEGGRS